MVTQETADEIESTLGLVPSFLEELPPPSGDQLWGIMRDLQLSDETEIPPKYKELIGLAAAAATNCRYCTLFHTEAAKLHGATPEEIAEANNLAGMTTSFSTFLHGQQTDLNTFRKETEAIVRHIQSQQG